MEEFELDNLWSAMAALAKSVSELHGAFLAFIADDNADRIKALKALERSFSALDSFSEAMEQRGQPMRDLLELVKAQALPKRVVRDASGRITGVETVEQ